jgi:hypothetical protein
MTIEKKGAIIFFPERHGLGTVRGKYTLFA